MLLKIESRTKDIVENRLNRHELMKLRNALVHFRPDWDSVQEHHGKLGKQLKGAFPPSPFVSSDTAPFFPTRCMSHGCAAWAVRTAWNFGDAFAVRLGTNSKFQIGAENLVTEHSSA